MTDLAQFIGSVWTEKVVVRDLIASALLVLLVIAGRSMAVRSLRRLKWVPRKDPLRLNARLRWVAIVVIVLGLVVIWASELRTLALSLVAIAAAIVLATKEIIMCLSGALVRASSQSFEIGDRVEIDGVRGDVIDHQLLTTTLLEIGPGQRPTGRRVVVPNSAFLSGKVFNDNLTDDYVLHVITVPADAGPGIKDLEQRLLDIAGEVCGPFIGQAERALDATASSHGLQSFSAAPRVVVQLTDPGQAKLLLHVSAPARERGEIEQQILRRLLYV